MPTDRGPHGSRTGEGPWGASACTPSFLREAWLAAAEAKIKDARKEGSLSLL